LPPFSILERTTRHARALAHRKLCGSVFARLTAEERQALDRLLVIPSINGERQFKGSSDCLSVSRVST